MNLLKSSLQRSASHLPLLSTQFAVQNDNHDVHAIFANAHSNKPLEQISDNHHYRHAPATYFTSIRCSLGGEQDLDMAGMELMLLYLAAAPAVDELQKGGALLRCRPIGERARDGGGRLRDVPLLGRGAARCPGAAVAHPLALRWRLAKMPADPHSAVGCHNIQLWISPALRTNNYCGCCKSLDVQSYAKSTQVLDIEAAQILPGIHHM